MSIDLSLSRMVQLLPDLPYTRPTLHIAGTNGKGSVSALLTSILLATPPSPSQQEQQEKPQPLRVGRFNSPHLVSVLDSITLSNTPVSQALYDTARAEVLSADTAHNTRLTPFEVLTLTALRIFETQGVDIVVLEVGLGGRLDATNVVPDESIWVSALTAVDLDHQAFLGATVGLIAKEKVGIARRGKPFVLGRQAHEEVVEVVREAVQKVGGVLVPALEVLPAPVHGEEEGARWSLLDLGADGKRDIAPPPQAVTATLKSFPNTPLRASLPLHGAHQLDNLGTALGVIDALLLSSSASSATSSPSASPSPSSPLSLAAVAVPPSASSLNLQNRITIDSIAQGIKNTRWPGRLSFHTLPVSLPLPVSTPPSAAAASAEETRKSTTHTHTHTLAVLADGAHNPASAETLGAYITRLLELTQSSLASSTSSSTSVTTTTPASETITITYILSLSHSPPKTPLQTLAPILPPRVPPPPPPTSSSAADASSSSSSPSPATQLNVKTRVALVRFTPPEGMPWVKPVPPREVEEVVRGLVPGLSSPSESSAGDLWVDDSDPTPSSTSASPSSTFGTSRTRNKPLEDALRWAAQCQLRDAREGGSGGGSGGGRGLVVLAGSLYLVADFYRILEGDGVGV